MTETLPAKITEMVPSGMVKSTIPAGARLFRYGRRGGIILSRDDGRLHLSISFPDRLPTWDEIKHAREELLPEDAFFCVPYPPKKYWMSVHAYAMHLYEVRDETLVNLWTEIGEALGAAASRNGRL